MSDKYLTFGIPGTPSFRESYSSFDICHNPDSLKKSEVYIMHDLFSGSDYSGGIVYRSNYEAFLKKYKFKEGIVDIYGGHNTYGVAIRLDVYESEKIQEIVSSLEEYCIYDEDHYDHLRLQTEERAWKDWIRGKVLRDLEEQTGYRPRDVRKLFNQAIEEAQIYWDDSDGGYSLGDREVEKAVYYIADLLIATRTKTKDLPLLVSRKWLSDEAEKLFKSRLKG